MKRKLKSIDGNESITSARLAGVSLNPGGRYEVDQIPAHVLDRLEFEPIEPVKTEEKPKRRKSEVTDAE